jgi:hypothetical protein
MQIVALDTLIGKPEIVLPNSHQSQINMHVNIDVRSKPDHNKM